MATDLVIKEQQDVFEVTMKAASSCKRGDLLGYSSGWVKADADVAAGPIYAECIALEGGGGSDVIPVARKAMVYDVDAPYTGRTAMYLSGTAGAHTETRPGAGVGNLIQCVGYNYDTYRALIDIKQPTEFEIFLSPDVLDTSSEPGIGKADTGWPGPELTSTETAYFKGRIPESVVGSIVIARMIGNSVNASAGDLDFTIVGSYDGVAAAAAANNQDTGTPIEAGDWVQTDANDKILTVDVSALFDAGFWLPGRTFAIYLDPDGITGALQILGLYIVGLKV